MILFLFFLKITLTYGIAPVIGAALISAAAGGAQTFATGKMNKKSRNFQREMFDKTNKYNSPLEQRKRLEAAGLNPNLVYGGSSGGTAGTASQPAKPDFNTPEFSKIGEPLQQGVMDYYNVKAIQAGTDVNEAREEQIKQDTINKGIEAVNKTLESGTRAIDLRTKQRLYDTNVKMAEENLRNLSASADYTTGKNTREERVTNATVSKIAQEISNLKKQGRILNEDAIIKKLDRILYEDYNVRPDDPFYAKVIGRILKELEQFKINTFKR